MDLNIWHVRDTDYELKKDLEEKGNISKITVSVVAARSKSQN